MSAWCSGGQSVNTVAPWAEGQIDLRYVESGRSRRCHGAHRRDHRAQLRAGHQDGTDDPRRIPAAGADATAKRLFEIYVRPRPIPGSRPTASSPAAAPIQASPPASARRPSARWGRWAARRTAPTSSCASTAWCRARRPARGRSCGWSRRGCDAATRRYAVSAPPASAPSAAVRHHAAAIVGTAIVGARHSRGPP